VWTAVIDGHEVVVPIVVPLVIGITVLAGNLDLAVLLPDCLRGMDKVVPDSSLLSVLLLDAEAAVKAEELCG